MVLDLKGFITSSFELLDVAFGISRCWFSYYERTSLCVVYDMELKLVTSERRRVNSVPLGLTESVILSPKNVNFLCELGDK